MTVGIDARLKLVGNLYDLDFNPIGDIDSEDFFDTAIIVSLFAEKRANESEVLEPLLRRGWIGNEVTSDFEIGSKIWLYEQSRLTNSVLNGIINTARQSLQWLVDDGFAVSIDDVEAIVTATGINLTITIRRPNSKVEKRHYTLWENSGLTFSQGKRTVVIELKAADIGLNLFSRLGNPQYPVHLTVNINENFRSSNGPAIWTGGPWQLGTFIFINIASSQVVAGHGGKGGAGAVDWEGTPSRGGGGGGGAPFGLGGDTFGAADGGVGTAINGGTGASGLSGNGGATEDRSIQNGFDGSNAIELGHNVTIENGGTIAGGAGGGGGGAQNSDDGGNGGSQAGGIGDNSDSGSGIGGVRGKAINLNGFTATFTVAGSVLGDVT